MDNIDMYEMIEKYKQELVEFSQNNKVMTETEPEAEESIVAVPVANVKSVGEADITSLEGTNPSGFNAGRKEKKYKTYEEFLSNNTQRGKLKVQTFTANRIFPASGAEIKIYKPLENSEQLVFEGRTDSSGIIRDIILPAPDIEYSENFSEIQPFATYKLFAQYEGFVPVLINNLTIFPDEESVQPIDFVPADQDGKDDGYNTVNISNPIDL